MSLATRGCQSLLSVSNPYKSCYIKRLLFTRDVSCTNTSESGQYERVTNISGRLYGDTKPIVLSKFPCNMYVARKYGWSPIEFHLCLWLHDWHQESKECIHLHLQTSKTLSHHTCDLNVLAFLYNIFTLPFYHIPLNFYL